MSRFCAAFGIIMSLITMTMGSWSDNMRRVVEGGVWGIVACAWAILAVADELRARKP